MSLIWNNQRGVNVEYREHDAIWDLVTAMEPKKHHLDQDDSDAAAVRCGRRLKLFQPARMVAGAEPVRVHLLDLSSGGALVYHADPPPVGAAIRLECAGRLRLARVAWTKGPRFGVAFALALSDDQLARTLAAQQAAVAPRLRSVA